MELNQYFDFLAADDIRIKGHRIGIETGFLRELLMTAKDIGKNPVSTGGDV
jgi:hypothetical protein